MELNEKCYPVRDCSNYRLEKILLINHRSSETLKREIRQKILNYQKDGWNWIHISSKSPFIYLKFEKNNKLEKEQ